LGGHRLPLLNFVTGKYRSGECIREVKFLVIRA
jgi:hypothetical protein